MISVSGIGSGLDLESLVNQLLAAEGQPAQARLDQREATLQAQLSAVGSLKGALGQLRDSSAALGDLTRLLRYQATSSNDEIVEASATGAEAGASYGVEVRTLAAAQRLASAGFDDPNDVVGGGTLTIERGRFDAESGAFALAAGASPITIDVDAVGNTLSGIRDALQEAGIHANVIHDGSGYRLALGPTATGLDNSLRITVDDADGGHLDQTGLSRLAFDPAASEGAGRNLIETVAASDAELVVDGLPVTRSQNIIDDLLVGITLDLKKAAPGEALTVGVSLDQGAAASSIEAFVEGYNQLTETARGLTGSDPETGERGPLIGDASVRGLLMQLRRALSESVEGTDGAYRTLTDLGISTARDGSLALDAARLQAALADAPSAVAAVFAQVAEASDPLIEVSKVGDSVSAGARQVALSQLPSAASFMAASLSSTTVDASNDGLRLQVDGISSELITLEHGSFADGTALAAAMQEAVNSDAALRAADVSVRVSYESGSGALVVASTSVGADSGIEILEADTASASTLGLSVGLAGIGQDVAGTIGGLPAIGEGRLLNGTGSLAGLGLEIGGGALGDRGQVRVSGGVAARLEAIIDQFLDSDGALTARSEGISARIEDLGRDRERLELRLTSLETRLRAEFGALDQLVADLTATGNFLNQQLASLPGFGGDKNG